MEHKCLMKDMICSHRPHRREDVHQILLQQKKTRSAEISQKLTLFHDDDDEQFLKNLFSIILQILKFTYTESALPEDDSQ